MTLFSVWAEVSHKGLMYASRLPLRNCLEMVKILGPDLHSGGESAKNSVSTRRVRVITALEIGNSD